MDAVYQSPADELTSHGKPMDHEDLLEKILDGLGSKYQSIINAVHGYDTPISFDELNAKLINKEITHSLSFTVPATANPTAPRLRSGYHGPFSTRALHTHTSTDPHLLWLSRLSTTITTLSWSLSMVLCSRVHSYAMLSLLAVDELKSHIFSVHFSDLFLSKKD